MFSQDRIDAIAKAGTRYAIDREYWISILGVESSITQDDQKGAYAFECEDWCIESANCLISMLETNAKKNETYDAWHTNPMHL